MWELMPASSGTNMPRESAEDAIYYRVLLFFVYYVAASSNHFPSPSFNPSTQHGAASNEDSELGQPGGYLWCDFVRVMFFVLVSSDRG